MRAAGDLVHSHVHVVLLPARHFINGKKSTQKKYKTKGGKNGENGTWWGKFCAHGLGKLNSGLNSVNCSFAQIIRSASAEEKGEVRRMCFRSGPLVCRGGGRCGIKKTAVRLTRRVCS